MSAAANFDPELCKMVFFFYANGTTEGEICRRCGISSANLFRILKTYPKLKLATSRKRRMNLKKKRDFLNNNLKGPKVKKIKKGRRKALPAQEKIQELERKLRFEQQKNLELNTFLEAAKEALGKH
jgi:hypothetical protein